MTDWRAQIVAEARSWIGTPYHHMADLKGVGVDCGKFAFCVYRDAGLLRDESFPHYSPDWMLARENDFLEALFRARFDLADSPEEGDAMLFRAGRNYCHLGIVARAAPLAILHAAPEYGFVIEEEAARVQRIRRHLHDALIGRPKGLR